MQTRDRLFAAAREIFEREGLDGLSIRAVGRAAGMSAMAIYRHFPDKDALVDALILDGFQSWNAIALAIDREDPVAWLERLLEAYRDFALDQPHRFDAAFLLPARGARTYSDEMGASRSPVVGLMMEQIARGQAQGRITDDPPLDVALILAALAQGLASMHRAGRFESVEHFRKSYQIAADRGLAGFVADGGEVRGDR